MTQMLLFAIIQWGLLTGWIAASKHRNPAAWFAIGAALPLIGLIMLMVTSPRAKLVTASA